MVDFMITLFESTSVDFTTNGLGNLLDAVSCIVTEERNGEYELEMTYPIKGKHYDKLAMRRIIVAKSNPYSAPQPFRIYAITKPINGIVTVNAEHISYDLSGYPVLPFSADSINKAFINMKKACAVECPFIFSTDKTTLATMEVLKPSSMRALLGGVEGSFLDVYGGEYEFDRFSVKLWNHRGTNRGVSIRYGKNLTDLEQEENCSSVYTGVYPFWYSEQDGLMQLDEKIIYADGTYDFVKIYPLDLSSEWTEKPSEEELRVKAQSYIKNNKIGIPKVSLTISFVQLAQSEEYADFALLETVHLCDTVNVEFLELGVHATAKCIKTVYNVLTGKYDSIELGDAKSNLAFTVSAQNSAMKEISSATKTFMEQAIENATQLISGGLGGYVIIHSSTNGKYPDEILIMDTDNIKTATKVWRWNKGGLGYSSTGYNGPYTTAITQDGRIVADFIAVGELNGALIKAGSILGESLDIEYKNSVDKCISDGDKALEETIETKFKINSDGIAAEIKRAKDKEDALQTQIAATSDAVKIKVSSKEVESLIEQKAESIRLKASKISWQSLYSSMSETGILKCTSAEIQGTFQCGLDSGFWVKLKSIGQMSGGYGSEEYGYIDYSGSARNLDTGIVYHGIQIKGGCLRISVEELATRQTSDISTVAYIGTTGTLDYISEIRNNSDGTITWTNSTIRFENGLMVSSL